MNFCSLPSPAPLPAAHGNQVLAERTKDAPQAPQLVAFLEVISPEVLEPERCPGLSDVILSIDPCDATKELPRRVSQGLFWWPERGLLVLVDCSPDRSGPLTHGVRHRERRSAIGIHFFARLWGPLCPTLLVSQGCPSQESVPWSPYQVITIPGPSFGVSWLEVPNSSGLGRNQPGDPDMKVIHRLLIYKPPMKNEEDVQFK